MVPTYDLVLKHGTVVNHDAAIECDVAVRDGRIAGVGSFPREAAGEVMDCRGLHILPGVIDTHVHFREPGNEHKEDFGTGSRAAVLGGVTAIFEMPNSSPPTTTVEALAEKVRAAAGRMHCDFAFWVGATRENTEELGELECLPGCCGVKVFMGSSTGSLLVEDDDSLERILSRINRRAGFHSEDEFRLRARKAEQREGDPSSHTVWRDAETARLSTGRLLKLARRAGKPVHVLHVSSAEELPLLAANRDIASFEVTPQHLTLTAPEAYERLGTLAQMNPPLRVARHAAALWHALRSGLVATVGSDHAPHTLEEKEKPYPHSPSGMPGVQTLVPIMLDHVAHDRLSLERLVSLTSTAPARLFGITAKGRIAEGNDASFTIVDLKARRTITNAWIASRCGWTPYAGREVTGWPLATYIRGNCVMRDDEVLTEPIGRKLEFV